MTIRDDTTAYESWLGRFAPLHADDLAYKHARMADAHDPFPFFRGTYYRWLRHWPAICPELDDAPRVPAVGDLHVENFGTWRDAEGRLVWGVNDFDEATELPYTNDLARLACSVRFARGAGPLRVRTGPACAAILRGYQRALDTNGEPFVLEERHPELRQLAYAQERDPARFWKRLTRLLLAPPAAVPEEARAALLRAWPVGGAACEIRFRPRAGMGSLGKPRFVALAEWEGAWLAREAKAVTPPASRWLSGGDGPRSVRLGEIAQNAVRCPDPFFRVEGGWVVRRLAPRCSRIELTQLQDVKGQVVLLEAIGAEAANVHLGAGPAIDAVRHDLARRKGEWLRRAARRMFKVLAKDWKAWREREAAPPGAR
jgi:hypothetical protein